MKKIFCFAIAALSALTAAFGQTVSESAAEPLMQVTTRLPGHGKPSTITVAVRNGIAIYQDDIVLGPIEEILNPDAQDRGLVIEDLDDRWPDGIIPFEIDEDFSAAYKEVILTAIEYINGSTNLLLVPRGDDHYYWLDFEPSDVCQSKIGLQQIWGQTIELHDYTTDPDGNGCGFRQIIHEIAHAAGIWHEQCRADRDEFVDIHWDNIKEEKQHNFLKNIDDNMETGPYDFSSQMHYGSRDFAIDEGLPTITRKNGSEEMCNLIEYSAGDVAAINWLYPVKNCSFLYTFSRPGRDVNRPLFYQAALSISSNIRVAASNLTYDAGYAIILSPGFEASEGVVFRAVIDGCGGQVLPLISADADAWYAQTGTYEERLSNNLGTEKPVQEASAESLIQSIAPNPFSGSTTVTYFLQGEQQVAMNLMDATGKLVATPLPAETQSEGEHQLNLEAGSLPAGLYFLVLQMGEKQETKRLILTK